MRSRLRSATLAGLAAAIAASTLPVAAQAQDVDRINSIQQQINVLQQELRRMRQEIGRRDAAVRDAQRQAAEAKQQAATIAAPPSPSPTPVAAPAPSQPPSPLGEFHTGGLTIKLGGFIEAAGIWRSRNDASDIASTFSGIPLPNSPAYHESELRGTARQSRISLLVQGNPDSVTQLTGYTEVDFLGAAPTANSTESNSYNPRVRQLWGSYERSDWGLHVLAGQAWSMLTLDEKGIVPRTEVPPLTIDAQYVPGFTWARQPQARVVKDMLDRQLWIGLSVENPQTNYITSGFSSAAGFPSGTNGVVLPVGGFANVNNAGGSAFAPTVNYSSEIAPDIVAKVAWDPGYGHYEVYGVARFLHDRVDAVGRGHNNTSIAGGGGAGTLVPIIPGVLEARASFLAGYGIGRYGAGQLPDATISPTGNPVPLPEVQALVGLTGHPIPAVDIYGYIGTEQAGRAAFVSGGRGFGYGSPLLTNTGCFVELSAATCTGNTSSLTQGTVGAWWRWLHGNFGTIATGVQYSYTKRDIFRGVGGSPSTDDNMILVSFRYFPFQ